MQMRELFVPSSTNQVDSYYAAFHKGYKTLSHTDRFGRLQQIAEGLGVTQGQFGRNVLMLRWLDTDDQRYKLYTYLQGLQEGVDKATSMVISQSESSLLVGNLASQEVSFSFGKRIDSRISANPLVVARGAVRLQDLATIDLVAGTVTALGKDPQQVVAFSIETPLIDDQFSYDYDSILSLPDIRFSEDTANSVVWSLTARSEQVPV